MRRDDLDRVQAVRAAGRPVAIATWLAGGRQVVWEPAMAGLDTAVVAEIERAVDDDVSRTVTVGGEEIFLHVFSPPLRLIVVGAVHIAQPLARMAVLAGYGVTLVDPRRSFADAQRFPDVTVSTDWPDDALETLAPDRRTAVVTLTHDPKIDDPALAVALRSPAFYIGALGSRRTHANRLQRLGALGFDAGAMARIHGPVGLDIGALSPAEIALSIMAQITQVRRLAKAACEAA
ncbi:MAG: xanthine dehydrogenase [Alphaproteobacteria bacterium]|nr:xanthine dehydrogenase [Alphaproteobacteria bacterium]